MHFTKLLAATLLLFSASALAEQNFGTGLQEPTPAQLKQQHKRKIKKVRPTRKALDRANEERRKHGKPELDPRDAVDPNSEVESEINGATTSPTTSTELLSTNIIPASVDNTQLPSFPPIANQGAESSCVAFATTYYQMSHETCLARGCDNKNLKQAVFSPKWTYNMINGGKDGGAYFSDANNLLERNGAAMLSALPYTAGDYLAWDLNSSNWMAAIRYRMNPVQTIAALDTDAGLDNAKQLLANGHVLVIGTYITSWVMTTVKADPAESSNPFAGQPAMAYLNGTAGAHAMTMAGYDDSVWVDINNNGVVDNGEKGAFKIVNSWGTACGAKCGNGTGYIWMPYDAIKATSVVQGANVAGRLSALQSKAAYFQSAKVGYKPKMIAQFTLNTTSRSQVHVKVGASATTSNSPSSFANTGAINYAGGSYALDGSANPVNGTFYLDLTDLMPSGSSTQNYYLSVTDSTSGAVASISNFGIYDANSVQLLSMLNQTNSVDANTLNLKITQFYSDQNQLPVASINTSTTVSNNSVSVDFDASSSYDSDGTINGFVWDFGDGSPAVSGAQANHVYTKTGNFTATLTVTDNTGAIAKAAVTVAGPADTIAPTAPGNLTFVKRKTSTGKINFIFSWKASIDNNAGAITYYVYRNGVLMATTTDLSYKDTTTQRGKSYTYVIYAKDIAGNTSAASNSVLVKR